MFVPVSDDNPLRHVHRPWVTWTIIALCCGIFVLQETGVPHRVLASFAIVPAELFKVGVLGGPAFGPNDALAVPERYTLVSYMFLHGDIMHLVGKMLFLWVFGDNVEDALGHLKYALFYVLCGIAGGLMHAVMLPGSGLPLIGASGAIAGVIAAYVILYPRVMVWVLAFRFIPLKITAAFALGAWILTQFAMLAVPYVMPGADIGPISWWSHIGGIVAGAAALLLMGLPARGHDSAAR
jgi:membrane associated rhomboid family serine protease